MITKEYIKESKYNEQIIAKFLSLEEFKINTI